MLLISSRACQRKRSSASGVQSEHGIGDGRAAGVVSKDGCIGLELNLGGDTRGVPIFEEGARSLAKMLRQFFYPAPNWTLKSRTSKMKGQGA